MIAGKWGGERRRDGGIRNLIYFDWIGIFSNVKGGNLITSVVERA